MIGRWCLYLVSVLGCIVFYLAYQGWLAWLILIGVLCLPLLSLLLSIPFMLKIKLAVQSDSYIRMGTPGRFRIFSVGKLPPPPWRSYVGIRRTTTGEHFRLKPSDKLPTDHCGQLICRPEKAFVYDYLKLFRLRIQNIQEDSAVIRPIPIPTDVLPELDRFLAKSWRPKPGGGFAENHELRLYRPGDQLNQVHWKLTAKTGKLIIREAMEPTRGRVLLTMDLKGTADELDEHFGRLLWLGSHLLQKGMHFELRLLTGRGLITRDVLTEDGWFHTVDEILCMPPVRSGTVLGALPSASWHYHIGGDPDEV